MKCVPNQNDAEDVEMGSDAKNVPLISIKCGMSFPQYEII